VSDSTILFGFFNAEESMRIVNSQAEGLPASFLGWGIEGPSREGFFFAPAYRVGGQKQFFTGDGDRLPPRIYPDGAAHDWSLRYDPTAEDGRGRITVALDGRSVSIDLERGARDSGVRFDRLGFVTTWIDGNAQEVYLDDLVYTAE
jgi:hypothetical protein